MRFKSGLIGGALLTAAAWAAGCELAVPGDLPVYMCSGSDPSVCPVGQYCSQGTCVPCNQETCGALEGGTEAGLDAGGEAGFDAAVDATGAEAADSVAPDSTMQDTSVPDVVTDVPPPPDGSCGGAVGCPCTLRSDCRSDLCGDSTVFSPAFVAAHGQVCTETCCTSTQCPTGYVCYAPGYAGNYCVLASWLSRAATPGTNAPGAACTLDGDCRSGKCISSQCIDTCCADGDCTNGTSCAVYAPGLDGHELFACYAQSGAAPKQTCTSSSQCASDYCDLTNDTCRPHCCGLSTCTSFGFDACEPVSIGSDETFVCTYPNGPPTGGAFGASCTDYTQCATRACDVSTHTCAARCCTNADCAQFGNYVCRPQQDSPYAPMCLAP